MKPKREVSSNLGRTQHRDAEKYYRQIKRRIGPYRRCPFYSGKKYPQFDSNEHDRLNPRYPNPRVPVEQFDFQYDKTKKHWTLQAYCKVCYKAYRDARIGKARSGWIKKSGKPMSDADIRAWYRKDVGPSMRCSMCRKNLSPEHFPISRSMEKGLHNICQDCAAGSGASVREQEWLADGDWTSWKRAVAAMRKKKRVKCAGWPRSVALGECAGSGMGKRMHADHWVPLRAGGIHDAANFKILCTACNIRKSDQIDPRLTHDDIRALIAERFRLLVKTKDSLETVERKLKASLVKYLSGLVRRGAYLAMLRRKKKQVNGQWNPTRAYRKGVEWLKRVGGLKSFEGDSV